MPIYEYECAHCGCFEQSQSIHDPPLSRCPTCRRKVQRLISATSFMLKGSGWYSDGYAKKPDSSATPKTESNGGEGETSAAGAADAKPAAKEANASPAKTKKARKKADSPASTTL